MPALTLWAKAIGGFAAEVWAEEKRGRMWRSSIAIRKGFRDATAKYLVVKPTCISKKPRLDSARRG